jgi:acetylornithine deacetylase/succinyl-diaminopimelate desuccinylase-like protein
MNVSWCCYGGGMVKQESECLEKREVCHSIARLLVLAAALLVIAAFGIQLASAASPQSGNKENSTPTFASDRIPPERMNQYSDLAVDWMQQYLRINTTNPPGNELKTALFFQKIFDTEGIENRVFEYAPGRANIWARLQHTVADAQVKRPIVLLSHMDVVSSEPSHWRVPPFSGEILEGSMYGRGAQDMKDEGLAQAVVLVMLKRERVALDRDVIFLATADEEVDDTGSKWFIQEQRNLLGNAEFLITEGGENLIESNRPQYIGIDVAEKAPFWLHVVAHGTPGHGSRPIEDSAPNRLVQALNRIVNYRTELKVLPVVEQYLHEMSTAMPPDRAKDFRNIRQSVQDKSFRESLEHDSSINYMLRNTIALTMLGGSAQTNVIPNDAWANLDVRLLPEQDPQQFLAKIRDVVADPNVTVEPLKGFSKANASPTDTTLFASIRRVSSHYFAGTPIVPRLTSGYTENQLYRQLGIVCYGYSPFFATSAEGSTEHGDNERIRVEELRRGPRVLYDVVAGVAAAY